MTDSTAFREMIDRAVREELQRRVDIQEWIEQKTVTETLSAPDSSGTQHVTERQTTTFSKHSEASAVSAQIKDEKNRERKDSSNVRTSDAIEVAEEVRKITNEAKTRIPWYIYAIIVALSAAVGYVLGVRVTNKR